MIRKANLYDLEAIYSLYTAYLLDISRVHDPAYASTVQRDGFTVAPASKEKLAQRIENNVLFNIFEADEEMLGFININREIYFPEDSDKIIWFSKAFKDNYFHNEKSIVLHEIIIDVEHKRKGIGKQLLEDSLQSLIQAGYQHVFSLVVLSPLTNCASVLFHTKMGFERACATQPIDYHGLHNYQRVLFYREIQSKNC